LDRPETSRHHLGRVLWPTLETVIVANSFTGQGFLKRRRLSILHLLKTRRKLNRIFVRRCREGYEFFKSLRQRKEDLAAARTVASSAAPAGA
jgi:hypothetical protein